MISESPDPASFTYLLTYLRTYLLAYFTYLLTGDDLGETRSHLTLDMSVNPAQRRLPGPLRRCIRRTRKRSQRPLLGGGVCSEGGRW